MWPHEPHVGFARSVGREDDVVIAEQMDLALQRTVRERECRHQLVAEARLQEGDDPLCIENAPLARALHQVQSIAFTGYDSPQMDVRVLVERCSEPIRRLPPMHGATVSVEMAAIEKQLRVNAMG